jgi:hypothetical protein
MLRFEGLLESSRRSTTTGMLARLSAAAVGPEGYVNCILTSPHGRKPGHMINRQAGAALGCAKRQL